MDQSFDHDTLFLQKLPQLFSKPTHEFGVVAAQFHLLLLPVYLIVNHAEVLLYYFVSQKLFDALVDCGVSQGSYLVYGHHFPVAGFGSVHGNQVILVVTDEYLFVVRIHPIFRVLGEVVSSFQFFDGSFPPEHLSLLLYFFGSDQGQTRNRLMILLFHVLKIKVGLVEFTGVGSGLIVAVSHGSSKNHDFVESSVLVFIGCLW